MKDISLNSTLKEKVSNKSGKTYYVVELQLTPTYTKQIFLETSEVELVKIFHNMNK